MYIKQFKHEKLENPLQRLPSYFDKDLGDRIYSTPSGKKYCSITKVLSVLSEEAIKKWKDRIGHEEANKISKYSRLRGIKFHSLMESYLKNEKLILTHPKNESEIAAYKLFKNGAMEFLNTSIDNIIALGDHLYSDSIKLAGIVDLICELDGVPTVIDFKTSSTSPQLEYADTAFAQVAGYSYMFEEISGYVIPQTAVIYFHEIPNSFGKYFTIFKNNRDYGIEILKKAIDIYNSNNS